MIQGIYIQPSAKQNLINEISLFKTVETGGVLCGHYQDKHLIIEAASGPGPRAMHTEVEFVMDKDFMHTYIDNEYNKSIGLNIFVGEWHTHPQKYPLPSEQDLMSIGEQTMEWQYGELVFLIVGFLDFSSNNLEEQMIAISFDKKKRLFYYLPITFL
ncbi:Mov34/MPN/PAD-1 family protein [Longitalea luteola]|uniref:Mov34/MPN/PAD-1 family protein n=1 Tax=Longitalea luteola TaxID=2812563 RepID=UPI001A961A5D|nr:Mov34/MPN/PAD-1 family protein [Longitalea luteola]